MRADQHGGRNRAFDALAALAAAELALPSSPSPAMLGALALAQGIVAQHGASVLVVLFYGSCRRTGDASSLLDLYVVHDGHRAFHGGMTPAVLNALLPPTVLLRCAASLVGDVRAKVAVLSQWQFSRRLRADALDTTIWARFCQPATLLYARDDAAAAWAGRAAARAFATAALWAVRLEPGQATPAKLWQGLFARTYGAELRAEPGGRSAVIYHAASAWFDRGLPLALAAQGLANAPTRPGARRWRAGWATRRIFGKALNVARLVKAAFTFEGGADYLAWKIERHSGETLALSAWQRRHPVLAAPALLWRLWRRGAVR